MTMNPAGLTAIKFFWDYFFLPVLAFVIMNIVFFYILFKMKHRTDRKRYKLC